MKIDGGMMGDLAQSGQQAAKLEALGYNGVVTAEMAHDPFFPLLLAAQETQSVELTTSIAVAFSRTPMNLANIGHDLNSFSKGRFVLGLGSKLDRTSPSVLVCLGPNLPLGCESSSRQCGPSGLAGMRACRYSLRVIFTLIR